MTLLQACTRAHGQTKGAVVAAWAIQWALTAQRLGRFPSTAEYADDWVISDRNAWRHRAAIKKALGPEYVDVLLSLARSLDARKSRRDSVNIALA